MDKPSKIERLAIQKKRDEDTRMQDIQNRQFEIFLNGPSYVDLATALTPKKQIRYDDPYSAVKEHLHLFAEMLDRLIAERKS